MVINNIYKAQVKIDIFIKCSMKSQSLQIEKVTDSTPTFIELQLNNEEMLIRKYHRDVPAAHIEPETDPVHCYYYGRTGAVGTRTGRRRTGTHACRPPLLQYVQYSTVQYSKIMYVSYIKQIHTYRY